ncbi:hypothetical protein LXL04_003045 [Taraxacum kok-saghyz]
MIIININLFSFLVYRRRSQRQLGKILSKFSNEQSTLVQISNSDGNNNPPNNHPNNPQGITSLTNVKRTKSSNIKERPLIIPPQEKKVDENKGKEIVTNDNEDSDDDFDLRLLNERVQMLKKRRLEERAEERPKESNARKCMIY